MYRLCPYPTKVQDGLLGNEGDKDGSDEAEVVQLHLEKGVELSATFNVGKVCFPVVF